MAFFDDLEPQDLSFAFQRPKKAEEGPGIVRGAADSALALGQGAVSGVKMLSDATGAGNDLSNFLGAANKYLESLESNERQAEKRQIAELIKQAEASGSPSAEIAAYLTHFTKAPLDTILNAIGSAAPTIGAAALAAGAGPVVGGAAALGMGAVQGAGVVKGTIYDRVKDELTQQGLPPEEVEARAQEAQAYAGPNAGLIGTGAGLGAVAGRFGAEGSLLARTAGTSSPNIVRRAAGAGVTEALPEGLQGGQEQYASNVAAQREGVDTPTWRGVLGSGALEAVAGGGVGATFGAMTPPRAAPAEPPGPLTRAAEIAAGVEAGMAAANQVPLLSGPGAQPASWEVVDDRPMLPGSSPAALAIGYTPEQTDGTIMVDPQGNAARMTPEFEREKGAERAAAQERAVETGLTPDVVEAQRRREAPVQVAPESIEDIVGAYRDEFETTPAGMTIEQMRSFAARRRAAEAEQIGKIAALAEREGVRVPARRGDSSMMMTPEPDDSGKWRITRFTKDGEPESHSVYNTAAEAAREILNNARVTRPGSGFRIEPAGDKAIVLLGDEKRALAGRIEQLGGKWNSARNGWTFPKTREPQVRQALADLLGGGNAQQPKSDTAVAPQGVRGQGGVAPGDAETGAGIRVGAGRDGDVAGAGRPDAGGQPTEPVRNGQSERNAALKPRTREQAAAQRRSAQEARDPFAAFLGQFGVSMRHQKDITGETGRTGNRMLPYYGPMFRKNGLPLDILAQYAVERGFLTQADLDSDTDTGGTRKLAEMIRRAHAREVVGTPMDEEARRNRRMQEESESQLYAHAASLGIDTEGMSPEDVVAYLEEHEEAIIADKANRMVQAAIDEEGYDSADAVILADVTIDEASRIALAARINEDAVERAAVAAGDDDIEFLTRIEEIIREAPDAERVAGRGQEVQATARSEAGDAEEAQAGRGRDAPVQEEGEAFGLTAPTPDEIRRQTQEQERAQQEARQREQAPPAEEFTLTGSTRPADEAAARGQMELAPAEGPKADQQDGSAPEAQAADDEAPTFQWKPLGPNERANDRWEGSMQDGFEPNAYQQSIMDAVRAALDEGKFYANEVKDFVAERLGVTKEQRALNKTNVEGGDFGYEVYLARRVVDKRQKDGKLKEATRRLNLKPGERIGALVFNNDFKRNTGMIVVSVDGDSVMLEGKRGGRTIQQRTDSLGVIAGIDRAKEKGYREDSADEFIAARAKPGTGAPEAKAEPSMTPDEAARYLKDFVYSLSNLDGMTDRAVIILGTGPLAKSGRDTLLMEAFGLTRDQAHEINNRLDSRQPKSLRNEDMQEAFTIFPGLRKVVDDALAEAKPRETRQRITPDAAGNMKPGDIIVDGQGREYRAHRARGEFLDAHPIVDGKANVSADTTVRFHLNPETAEAHPDRRADAVFATGRNLNEQKPSQEAKKADKPAGPIEDVGEQLYANRRNFVGRGLKWDDVSGMNDTLKVKEVKKAKVWPKPDYEKLIAEGMPTVLARMVKQVYDGLGAGPTIRGTPTDADLKRYIDTIGKVREAIFGFTQDKEAVTKFANGVQAIIDRERQSGPMSLMAGMQHAKELADTLLTRIWPDEMAKPTSGRFRRGSDANSEALVIGGNRALRALQFDRDDLTKWAKEVAAGWPAKREAWQVQGYMVVAPGDYTVSGQQEVTRYNRQTGEREATGETYFPVAVKGMRRSWMTPTRPAEGAYLLINENGGGLRTFDSEDAAIEAARELTKREKGIGQDSRGTNVSESERIGPARREEGENISSERFKEVFGFRGVNFGREGWIKQAERQEYLNAAYDGLLDLAEILNVPPQAMSLDGMLGIAFGAQGKGQFAAHFVPGHNEINLTKTRGAGTLAHEWGHALDHYFATQAGLAKDPEPMVSEHADKPDTRKRMEPGPDGKLRTVEVPTFGDGIRPEIVQAFRAIVQAMSKRPESEGEAKMRDAQALAQARKQTDRWLAAVRHNIEPMNVENKDALLAEFDRLAAQIREGDIGERAVKSGNLAFTERVAAIRDLVREATGRLLSKEQSEGLDSNARFLGSLLAKKQANDAHEPQRLVSTDYASESARLDAAKNKTGKKKYWSTPTEMFARAFETYVHAKLAERDQTNTFLTDAEQRSQAMIEVPDNSTAAGRMGATTLVHAYPYPRGVERETINTAFDTLVGAIKVRQGDRGLAVYEPKAQYRVDGQQGITAQEGGYQTDLFGDPLPSPRGNARPARPARAGVPGDVRPAAAVQDTAAPQGDYLVKTIVGSEARRTLGASSIKTAADAARATKYLYRHAVERFDGIVTDADGKPLAVVGGFKGALTQASVYPATLMGEAVRIPGAARIWFSHNHPSGSAELSAADVLLNGALTKVFKGSGIEPMGLLAIAGDRYAFVDPRQDSDSNLAIPNPQERVEVPVIERMLVPPGAPSITIDRPDAAKRIGKVYYDRMKQPGMLLLTAQNVVAAWVPLSPAMAGTLRGTGGMNALYRAASEANAAGVILVHGGELDSLPSVYGTPVIENIGAALRALDVTPLDAINVVSGESRAEKGGSLASGPVFARGAGRGLPTAEVSRISDAVRKAWANAPEVVVVPDMADPKIPAEVRDADAEMRASGAEGEPEGFFYGGKVYLVAGALDRPADVVRVMAHESLGHYGLRGVFGDRLASILGQIANARPREVAAKMREYGLTGVEGQLQAAEEVLAVMAQTNPKLGFVKRAIAAIRTWLRERGFDVRMSNDEIVRNFILPARAWVQRGGKAGTGAPAFSRRAVTQTPAFKAWFGESKVVDAEGRPLVVYHGTAASISAFAQWAPNFFTADPSYAEGYAGKRGESGGNIVPVFLSIQNPMDGTTAQGRALYDRYREFAADEYGREVPPLEDGQHVPFTEADRVFVFLRRIARTENSQVDGILVDEGGTQGVSWVPLRPEQIKSATGNRGTFDPANPDIRFSRAADVSPLGFYSELARRIESGPGRADAANWKAFIKSQKGIKPDEIEWTGINEFLDLQPGKITKEAVREFLGANGVKVEQVVLGEGQQDDDPFADQPDSWVNDERVLADGRTEYDLEVEGDLYRVVGAEPAGPFRVSRPDGSAVGDEFGSYYDARIAAEEDFVARFDARRKVEFGVDGPTKFAGWTIPGGTNYRELLLTLPKRPGRYEVRAGEGMWRIWNNDLDDWARRPDGKLLSGYLNEQDARRAMSVMGGSEANNFRSGHWDQPNVLAHVRFDERVDADGKRVLFINEIQSDWGQAGARKESTGEAKGMRRGFKGDGPVYDVRPSSIGTGNWEVFDTRTGEKQYGMPHSSEGAARAAAMQANETNESLRPPAGPFVTKTEAWVALALKRMIRHAAENGFDRVAIVSGQQAADLFDLSKQVRAIEYIAMGENDPRFNVIAETLTGSTVHVGIDTPSGLQDKVGKEIADRIGRGEGKRTRGGRMRLEGLDLKVGGEGMKGFYDRIVPTVAKDVLKKLGGGPLTKVDLDMPTVGGQSVRQDGDEWVAIDRTAHNQEVGRFKSRQEAEAFMGYKWMQQLGFDITPELRKRAMDGMPMFSRRPTRKQISDHIADALKSSKGFNWWHKTLGTQYEKAQVNPYFRRVFDGAQNFLNDVSDFANRAADLAPSILPKMNGIADVLKKPIPKKDLDAIARPIFEGTLENADPAKGKVWTDAELRSRFSLNDRQIGLYREFRAAVDKSLDDMGKTDLLRYAGKDGNPVREQVLEARTIRSAGQILAAHLNSIGQEETATTVIEKAARIEGLKAGGYAPLMRFGRFSVYVTRPDPEGGEPDQVYFGMFETQRDANRMARKFREDPSFADADVTQGTMSQEAFKLFQGVNPDTLELFADVAGIEQTELFQTYLKLAKSNRSAMKRLINRKGVAGFSEDVSRVLASFITSNAKAAASNLNIGEMNEAASSVPKEQGDVKDEAVRLVEFVRGTNDPSSKLRSLLFMQYLGGSVASALVNMTQPLTMTYPYLAQFLGAGKAGTVLGKAMKDAVTGVGSDKDLADALKQAESDGIVSPQEIHHLYSEAGIGLGRNTAIRRATFAWGSLFSAAEQFNRRSTFIAAYRTAREQGIANPFAFAEKAVVETQGIYARSNRPNWARNPVGATLLTFKQFSIAYLEFLKRLPPKERALALAVLVVAAGLEGLPGADDLDDLIDTAAQAMGYNWQTARKKREWLTAVLGQGGAEFALRGMSAVPGIPIDVSARLSVGNLVPGTGLLLGSTRDKSREITEVLGAGGSFAQNVLDAGALVLDGDMGRAAKTVAPLAVQNALKGLDMYQTGIYRDTKGRRVMDVDAYDAMVKAIGFQPAGVAANQRKAGMVFETVALVRNVESRIAEKWARGVFEKDADAVRESREELREWNRTNPEARIAINSAQIAKRVQAMRATRADRLAKTAPRELRQAVKEAL